MSNNLNLYLATDPGSPTKPPKYLAGEPGSPTKPGTNIQAEPLLLAGDAAPALAQAVALLIAGETFLAVSRTQLEGEADNEALKSAGLALIQQSLDIVNTTSAEELKAIKRPHLLTRPK